MRAQIYVPIPGVKKEAVTVQIGEDSVSVKAEGLPTGTYNLVIPRLFLPVQASVSQWKVQQSKSRVLLILAKLPPRDEYEGYKKWHFLHYGGNNVQMMPDESKL